MSTERDTLRRYLAGGFSSLRWKLEDLSEYDIRRPLVPTGTNLLGLVKHVASVSAGYFGPVFGRPTAVATPWFDGDVPNADMWATDDESAPFILGLLDTAAAEADATLEALPLTTSGHVPWWGDRGAVTLGMIAIHMVAEVHRHAGHADIVRELIDGRAGLLAANPNLPDVDPAWWESHHSRLQATAESFRR